MATDKLGIRSPRHASQRRKATGIPLAFSGTMGHTANATSDICSRLTKSDRPGQHLNRYERHIPPSSLAMRLWTLGTSQPREAKQQYARPVGPGPPPFLGLNSEHPFAR